MVNYKNSKIYKIISPYTNEIYIGSTTKKYLADRFYFHNCHYKQWLQGKCCLTSSFPLIAYGDAKIVLIEAYPCSSKDQLRSREQYWIDEFSAFCINKNSAMYNCNSKKIYMKKYQKVNSEKLQKNSTNK